jgi:DNA-binding PadR family transcriptional regulator
MRSEKLIAYDILNYLSKQPRAMDTFQGISEWWLLKEQIDSAVETVSRALELLVKKQYLTKRYTHNDKRYYQINREKVEDIREALEKMTNELSD